MGVGVGGKIGWALLGILALGAVLAHGPEMVAGGNASDAPDTPVASITIFGSNLISDPCATCNYSDGGGYAVVGPDNCFVPGTTQWLAGAFIAAATGVPEQISAPIILRDPSNCPMNTVTLSIYTDACYPNGPGTPLVSAIATVPVAPCALAVAKLPNAAPVPTKGTKYWVVATTNAQQAGLDSNWYGSNNSQYAYNTGTGWQHFTGATPTLMVEGFRHRSPRHWLMRPTEPLEAICLWTPAPAATTIRMPRISRFWDLTIAFHRQQIGRAASDFGSDCPPQSC